MTTHEDSFYPEQVDAQIQSHSSFRPDNEQVDCEPDTRLLHDLYQLHREQANSDKEDQRSLQLAWTRIALTTHQQTSARQLLTTSKHLRLVTMKKRSQDTTDLHGHRTLAQRLGMLSAVAVVFLLIGSAAFLFSSLRQSEQPTNETIVGANSQQTSTQNAAKQGETVFEYKQGGYGVYGVRWSPDGRRIASSSTTADTWDALTGENHILYVEQPALKLPSKPGLPIGDIAWSPDSKSVAIPFGSEIQIWDAAAKKQIKSFSYPFPKAEPIKSTLYNRFYYVNWSPDGKTVQAVVPVPDSPGGSNLLVSYDIATGKKQEVKLAAIGLFNRVAWSPDGKYLATSYMDKGQVYAIDLRSGQIEYTYQGPGPVVTMDWSPDSKRIAAGFGDGKDVTHVWDALSGDDVLVHKGGTTPVWSPDGKHIATARMDPTGRVKNDEIQIWDARTNKTIFTYKGHQGSIYALDWSPDGQYIASGEGGGNGKLSNVRVWKAL